MIHDPVRQLINATPGSDSRRKPAYDEVADEQDRGWRCEGGKTNPRQPAHRVQPQPPRLEPGEQQIATCMSPRFTCSWE